MKSRSEYGVLGEGADSQLPSHQLWNLGERCKLSQCRPGRSALATVNVGLVCSSKIVSGNVL